MEIYKNRKHLKTKDKVANVKYFYTTLMSKILLIIILATLNYYLDKWQNPWFLWVTLGLGISAIFKAIKVFGWIPFYNNNLNL